jgi:putative Mn2+ efflux pump MntP
LRGWSGANESGFNSFGNARKKGDFMGWLSLLVVACALAMDAFAVAIVTGLTLNPMTRRHVFRLAFHFGLFQALMPIVGWLAGNAVHQYIEAVDHWIAFGLLAFVGGNMIRGAIRSEDEQTRTPRDPTTGWELVVLSVATSIDALAVGLSLAMVGSTIITPAVVIGLVAATFTAGGMVLGRRIGALWGKRVEVLGGLVLVAIGVKIVIEHVFGR